MYAGEFRNEVSWYLQLIFNWVSKKTHMQKQIWRKIYRKQIGSNLNNCCLGMVYVCSVLVFQYFLMFEHVLNIIWERNRSCILIPYVHQSMCLSIYLPIISWTFFFPEVQIHGYKCLLNISYRMSIGKFRKNCLPNNPS